jgi:hypothetical protein
MREEVFARLEDEYAKEQMEAQLREAEEARRV